LKGKEKKQEKILSGAAPAPPQNPDQTPDLGGKISELSENIKSLEAENLVKTAG
jgi:hypothetical protein